MAEHLLAAVVLGVMHYACEWTGHRFECWNRPRLANRVWGWAVRHG